ncbi:MAG: hypothetical protein ACW99J_09080 [Candidatus Thorarchaeota archaeon]|jgi:hypothetical protein
MEAKGLPRYRHGKRGGGFRHHLKTMYDLRLSTSPIQREIETAMKLHNVGSGGD